MLKNILNYLIALVWLLNGLFCKLLNFVPRHQQIVGRILGDEHSFILIKLIGALEVLMVVWIISGIRSRWCAIIQILIIGTMNCIEITLAPDLLLYGRANIFPALLLMSIIFVNEFLFRHKGAEIQRSTKKS
ncbi:MAG: DoxX-like family protein [Bacteroidetes bacterium]|nr:DoxX-like family protein [Bacteroidota bacterium]